MLDIVLVRSSSPIYDPRVGKIVRSLNKKYTLAVLGWNREGLERDVVKKYLVSLHHFNMTAPFGSPSLVKYYPLFWAWVLIRLIVLRPRIVHACDLDTIFPCYLYKLIFRKKLVFEIFDKFAMVNIPLKYPTLYSAVDFLEDFFSKRADILVTVSQKLLDTFRNKPPLTSIVMNCPEEQNIKTNKSDIFTLVYTGPIINTRGLENIASAIKNLSNVQLVIAGRIQDKELFNRVMLLPNIRYDGLLLPSEALCLEAQSDAMIILYDPKIPINNYAMPNKLFEAMICGVPIITNIAPEVIIESGCGTVVDYNDTEQIKEAVVRLRDDLELRAILGKNSRKAFVEKYNWAKMEQEYYKFYDILLGQIP